jgi:hypothetical protein
VFLILGGCVGPRLLNTPSGGPEVFIPNETPKFVTAWIAAQHITGLGMRVLKLTDSEVLAAKTQYGSRPYPSEIRIHYWVAAAKGGVNVFAKEFLVQNPGISTEKISDHTFVMHNAEYLQNILEGLAASIPKHHR